MLNAQIDAIFLITVIQSVIIDRALSFMWNSNLKHVCTDRLLLRGHLTNSLSSTLQGLQHLAL